MNIPQEEGNVGGNSQQYLEDNTPQQGNSEPLLIFLDASDSDGGGDGIAVDLLDLDSDGGGDSRWHAIGAVDSLDLERAGQHYHQSTITTTYDRPIFINLEDPVPKPKRSKVSNDASITRSKVSNDASITHKKRSKVSTHRQRVALSPIDIIDLTHDESPERECFILNKDPRVLNNAHHSNTLLLRDPSSPNYKEISPARTCSLSPDLLPPTPGRERVEAILQRQNQTPF